MCAVQSCHMVSEFNARPADKSSEIRRDLDAYDAMCANRPLKPPCGEIPHRNVRPGILDAAKWRETQIEMYTEAPAAIGRRRGYPQLRKLNEK